MPFNLVPCTCSTCIKKGNGKAKWVSQKTKSRHLSSESSERNCTRDDDLYADEADDEMFNDSANYAEADDNNEDDNDGYDDEVEVQRERENSPREDFQGGEEGNDIGEERVEIDFFAKLSHYHDVVCQFIHQTSVQANISKTTTDHLIRGIGEIGSAMLGLKKFPKTSHKYSKHFVSQWDQMKRTVNLCTLCWAAHDCAIKKCTHTVPDENGMKVCGEDLYDNRFPKKSLTYVPIEESLKTVFSKDGMIEQCIQGLQRFMTESETVEDVFEGKMMRLLFKDEVKRFLDEETEYIPIYIMFSADGFSPLSHRSNYSSWNFMFQILNLPVGLRIKAENMLLFTVVPGPRAPSSMNGIIDLFVTELETLGDLGLSYKGLKFSWLSQKAFNTRTKLSNRI